MIKDVIGAVAKTFISANIAKEFAKRYSEKEFKVLSNFPVF